MVNVRKIQTGIKIFKKPINIVMAQSLPARKVSASKILSIKNPIIKDYAKRMGIEASSLGSTGRYFKKFQELSVKLEGVDDKFIKETIYGEIEKAKTARCIVSPVLAIDLLDVYHSIGGKYSMIGWHAQDYFKYLKNEVSKNSAKKIVGQKNPIEKLLSKLNLLHQEEPEIKKSFDKAVKFQTLKLFCRYCNKTKPEITNHLYENYYLPTLSPEAKNICKKISDEFNTKVFLEHDTNYKAPSAIYKEFAEWKMAGGSHVVFPEEIDFSVIKRNYIDNKNPSGGFLTIPFDNLESTGISIENDDLGSIKHSIRHEMAHLNDKKIIYKGKVKNGFIKKRVGERPYEDELKKAGISDTDYAYTDKLEFVARASQGDYSKYSDHFKKVLVRLGMPEWEFKMTPVKDMDYFK